MGNYVSCALSTSTKSSKSAAKVIFPNGEIRQFCSPTKAAELMLETPNHFLVNSRSLQIGRRFSALSADEDLQIANVYVMFPMNRVNSVVKTGDMGALFVAANSLGKRVSGGGIVRIAPEVMEEEEEEEAVVATAGKLSLEGIEEFSTAEFMHRLSMSRSKKPLLETIAEEAVYSR